MDRTSVRGGSQSRASAMHLRSPCGSQPVASSVFGIRGHITAAIMRRAELGRRSWPGAGIRCTESASSVAVAAARKRFARPLLQAIDGTGGAAKQRLLLVC